MQGEKQLQRLAKATYAYKQAQEQASADADPLNIKNVVATAKAGEVAMQRLARASHRYREAQEQAAADADPLNIKNVVATAMQGEKQLQRLAKATHAYKQAREQAAADADPFNLKNVVATAKAGEFAMRRLQQAAYRAMQAFDARDYLQQAQRVGDALRDQIVAADRLARAERDIAAARAEGTLTTRAVDNYNRALETQRRAVEQLRKEEEALRREREAATRAGRSGNALDSAAERAREQARTAAREIARLSNEADNAFDSRAYIQQAQRVADALREQLVATDKVARAQRALAAARRDGTLNARTADAYNRSLDAQRRAVQQLRKEEEALRRVRGQGVRAGRSGDALDSAAERAREQARAAAQEMSRLSAEAERASDAVTRGFSSAAQAPRGLIGVLNDLSFKLFVITFAARQMFEALLYGFVQVGEEILLFEMRVKALTGSTQAIGPLYDVATDLGVAIGEVSQGFTRFAVANTVMRRTQSELVAMTDAVLKFGLIAGSSTQEAAAGLQQLGQGLASNRLQGDELRSVLENLPLLAVALSDQLGISIGDLRDWGSQGKLTGEVVSGALIRAKEVADELYEDLPDTTTRAIARMQNEWGRFIAELQRGNGNAFVGFFNDIAAGLATLRKVVSENAGLIARTLEAAKNAALIFLAVFIGRRIALAIAGLMSIGTTAAALPPAFAMAATRAQGLAAALAFLYRTAIPLAGVTVAIVAIAAAFSNARSEARALRDEATGLALDLDAMSGAQLRARKNSLASGFADDLERLVKLGRELSSTQDRMRAGPLDPETGYTDRDASRDQQRILEIEATMAAVTDGLSARQTEMNEIDRLLGQTPEQIRQMEAQARIAQDIAGELGDQADALRDTSAQLSLINKLRREGASQDQIRQEVEALRERQEVERDTLALMEKAKTLNYEQAKAIVTVRRETERAVEAAIEQQKAREEEVDGLEKARNAWEEYARTVKSATSEFESNESYFDGLLKRAGAARQSDNVSRFDISSQILKARQLLIEGNAEGAVEAAKKAGALIEKYIDENDGVANSTARIMARRAADVGKEAAKALREQRLLNAERELETVDRIRTSLEELFGQEWKLRLGLDASALPDWARRVLEQGPPAENAPPPAENAPPQPAAPRAPRPVERGVGPDGAPYFSDPGRGAPLNPSRPTYPGLPMLPGHGNSPSLPDGGMLGNDNVVPMPGIEQRIGPNGERYFGNPGLLDYQIEPEIIIEDGQAQIEAQLGTPQVSVNLTPVNDVADDVGTAEVATRLDVGDGAEQIIEQVGVPEIAVRVRVLNPEALQGAADASGGRNPNSARARG